MILLLSIESLATNELAEPFLGTNGVLFDAIVPGGNNEVALFVQRHRAKLVEPGRPRWTDLLVNPRSYQDRVLRQLHRCRGRMERIASTGLPSEGPRTATRKKRGADNAVQKKFGPDDSKTAIQESARELESLMAGMIESFYSRYNEDDMQFFRRELDRGA